MFSPSCTGFLDGEAEPLNSSNSSNSSNTNGKKKLVDVKVTSYNPEAGQTDSTPCIAGGTGFNLCEMAAAGQRTIAVSQDLAGWSSYAQDYALDAGEKIWLESIDFPDDPRCNGEFIVSDAMNARYTNRADLFFLDRADNTSCTATIYTYQ